VVADVHGEWAAPEPRYFSEASMADLYPEGEGDVATGEEFSLSR
jgi:hypothetical protein